MGLPFCGFKLLMGVALLRVEAQGLWPLGGGLVGLGVLDSGINLLNLLGLLATGQRPFDACLLAWLSRQLLGRDRGGQEAMNTGAETWSWQDLGNSLDVLLSMTLVAVAVGTGLLQKLRPVELLIWNVGVICNVMGAGLGRLSSSLRKRRA